MFQRMRLKWGKGSEFAFGAGLEASGVPKTFQNLRVSSLAAVATVHPFGLWVMKSTLEVWPLSSAIFTIEGYFQRVSWFWEKPCELSNSLSFLFHNRAHTCDPVFTVFKQAPVCVFQNFMHWSPPPPPEASRFPWNGHHASAFTAAVCSSNLWSQRVGEFEEATDLSQMWIILSLPPLANCCPEGDHFSPQTSCWCPPYVSTMWDLTLTSLLTILPSIPPVERICLFQASEPTRAWCPTLSVLSCSNQIKSYKHQSAHVSKNIALKGNTRGVLTHQMQGKDEGQKHPKRKRLKC